jgi:TonB-linked SusC/RagA family outer membrane protein
MIKLFSHGQSWALTLLSCLLLSATSLFGQITITGKVTSVLNKEPLPGVSIQISGTTTGTITDINGEYSINVPDNKAVLTFLMVGMLTENIEVGNKTVIDVALSEDIVGLEEIVVIGYGTMKKRDVSGAIISVGEKEMSEVKSASVMESLQGKMAGVDINLEKGGETGSNPSILVRGGRSLMASNDPLIIVDGVPYGTEINISSNDIESIEVLKDASSTAIYGSRGANGVVIITTKKGKAGQSKVYFNSYYGITTPYQNIPVFDRDGYIKAKNDAYRDTSNNFANWDVDPNPETVFSTTEREGIDNGTYTNWQDVTTKNGVRQEYHLGVLGGKENFTYNTSLNYFKEDGITLSDNFKRYTYKLNLDSKVNKVIKVGGSAIMTYRQHNGRGVRFTDAVLLTPIVPAYDSTGKYIFQPDIANSRRNPLVYTDDEEQRMATRLFSSVYGQINILPSLYFKSNFGFDIENERFGFMYPKTDPSDDPTTSGVSITNNYAYTWTNILNFSKDFTNSNSSLNITLGHEVQYNSTEAFNMSGKNQPFTRNLWWNMGSVDQATNSATSFYREKGLVSFFGRMSFSYNDLILLNATGRYDGASQLTEGNKWSFFPSASVAIRLNKIEFIQNVEQISDLKLRFGYGVSGNADINAYATKGLINKYPLHYQFGDPGAEVNLDGYRPEYLASESLTWEITNQYNLGVDFGIFKNRLTGNLDFYKSKTEDVLLPSRLPTSTGFFKITTNAGEIETKGMELMLQGIIINRGDFKWDMNISFSRDRQKIVSLTSGVEQDIANGWFVGQPLKVFYDYKKTGIWQFDEADEAKKYGQIPGDIKVLDADQNDTINTDDRIILGSDRPKWTGSLVNTFTYKGIDLTFNIYSRIGQMIDADAYAFDPRMYDNMLAIDYWTPHNPTNDYPRLRAKEGAELDYENSLKYQDGSFIKLKNLTLGYSLPASVTEKVHMSKLRFYFSSNNTWIMYSKLKKGIDPERSGSISWPLARTYVFGLNVEF